MCFIPARKGSEIKNKNIINLSGHPMIAHTIDVAVQSKNLLIFCITDLENIKISQYYGCDHFL